MANDILSSLMFYLPKVVRQTEMLQVSSYDNIVQEKNMAYTGGPNLLPNRRNAKIYCRLFDSITMDLLSTYIV